MARDSLEVIKKQSVLSKSSKAHSASYGDADGLSIPTIPELRQVSPQTISHIEVAQIPTHVTETAVNFSPIAEVYEVNLLKSADSPWKIYQGKFCISAPNKRLGDGYMCYNLSDHFQIHQ